MGLAGAAGSGKVRNCVNWIGRQRQGTQLGITDGVDVFSLRITPAPIGSRVFGIRRHGDLELHGSAVARIENRLLFFDDGATPAFRQFQANGLRGDGNLSAIVEMRSERKLLSRSRQGE